MRGVNICPKKKQRASSSLWILNPIELELGEIAALNNLATVAKHLRLGFEIITYVFQLRIEPTKK